jgi:hypothetical protein
MRPHSSLLSSLEPDIGSYSQPKEFSPTLSPDRYRGHFNIIPPLTLRFSKWSP